MSPANFYRGLLSVLLALTGLAGASHAASGSLAYDDLTGRKALAQFQGIDGDVYGVAHAQASDIAASQLAMLNCEAKRPATAAPCEITRLNNETITSGKAIRTRAVTQTHPLYLWQYQSNTATVFLVGSIHVLKPSLFPLPRQVEAAFEAADVFVVEVDTQAISSAEMQALSLHHALLPGQQTLADVLPTPLYRRLNERLQAYGMSTTALARAKPAAVMNELVMARLSAIGYRPEYGLEQHFRARVASRQVLQLESIEAQLSLLFDQPMTTQLQLLSDTLNQEYLIEPMLTDMLVAWLSGNDKQLLALFEQQAGDSELARVFNRQLLDDRNVGMANKVRTYLAGQGTYFVLAGAAHFLGPQGIIARLSRQGVSGQRIMSDELEPARIH